MEIYERIRAVLPEVDPWFAQKADAIGKRGASTDQKLIAALRMLANRNSAKIEIPLMRLAESTLLENLKRFSASIVKGFGKEYLRLPTADELTKIEKEYAAMGFPGAIGCVDCASWIWDACPVAWQGRHKGKERKTLNRMEVVCDGYLRIWHVNFGAPGAKNDIQIMNASPLFNSLRTGKWPSTRPEIEVGGFKLKWYYFLADSIYPRFRFFVFTILRPRSKKETIFAKQQEGARKAVERVLGVLFKRWQILYRPSRLWRKSDMNSIVLACVAIHNMVEEERREQ